MVGSNEGHYGELGAMRQRSFQSGSMSPMLPDVNTLPRLALGSTPRGGGATPHSSFSFAADPEHGTPKAEKSELLVGQTPSGSPLPSKYSPGLHKGGAKHDHYSRLFRRLLWALAALGSLIVIVGVCTVQFRSASSDAARSPLGRYTHILRRAAWKHKYILPREYLDRGNGIVGDDRRLSAFMDKLIMGKEVHYALVGGSIATPFETSVEQYWPGVLHRWFELAFGECGRSEDGAAKAVRDPAPYYGQHFTACGDSSVKFQNLALGASTPSFAEQCLIGKVDDKKIDLVIVEYSNIGADAEYESRALERLLRDLLLMPSQPAILLFHTYSFDQVKANYTPVQEDLWYSLATYYSAVQTLSARSVIAPTMRHVSVTGGDVDAAQAALFRDTVHATTIGHEIYADILINYFQRLAERQIALHTISSALGPGALAAGRAAAAAATYQSAQGAAVSALSRATGSGSKNLQSDADPNLQIWDGSHLPAVYLQKVKEELMAGQLPEPLHPNNYDAPGSACFIGEAMQALAVGAGGSDAGEQQPQQDAGAGSALSSSNFKWVNEGNQAPRMGYLAEAAGAKLELNVDTTISGRHGSLSDIKVSIGYMRSRNGAMGSARVTCAGGCTCEPTTLDAYWEDPATLPSFASLTVTPSSTCRLVFEVLDKAGGGGGGFRFKLVGVSVSHNVPLRR